MGLFDSIKDKVSKKKPSSSNRQDTLKSQSSGLSASNNPFFGPGGASMPTRRPDRPGMSAFTVPSNAPPPAYTPAANEQINIQPPTPTNLGNQQEDDEYSFLTNFDTVFLIDDSGSMAGRNWRETEAALAAIAPICTKYDKDGIDIYFLNHPDSSAYKNVTSAAGVREIFRSVRPYGGTPTGQKLNRILRPYLQDVKSLGADRVRPLNIIVITDGCPSDDVESVILNAAKKLDAVDAVAWQVGIQFFQVGNEDGAAKALRELDDELAEQGDVRDMVDTVPWVGESGEGLNAQGIMKVVLGAVNRKLDRKKKSSEWRR